MSDQELKDIQDKLDRLMRGRSFNTSSMLNFIFSAGMPVVIAVLGIYFTNENNKRQIEFQQIQVADQMIGEVQGDDNFTKEKLDLKLSFVENMFEDPKFKAKVKDMLSQTYAVSLQSMDLAQIAQDGNADDVKYVQNKIAEAKKFGDTSINKVVKQLEQKEPIRKITKPDQLKDTAAPANPAPNDSITIKRNLKNLSGDSTKSTTPKKPSGREKPKKDNT